jgi:hypothetical protein
MKKLNSLLAVIFILCFAAMAVQAAHDHEKHEVAKSNASVNASLKNDTPKIGEILKNQSAYLNEWVTLNGTIISGCKMGYKFKLTMAAEI